MGDSTHSFLPLFEAFMAQYQADREHDRGERERDCKSFEDQYQDLRHELWEMKLASSDGHPRRQEPAEGSTSRNAMEETVVQLKGLVAQLRDGMNKDCEVVGVEESKQPRQPLAQLRKNGEVMQIAKLKAESKEQNSSGQQQMPYGSEGNLEFGQLNKDATGCFSSGINFQAAANYNLGMDKAYIQVKVSSVESEDKLLMMHAIFDEFSIPCNGKD